MTNALLNYPWFEELMPISENITHWAKLDPREFTLQDVIKRFGTEETEQKDYEFILSAMVESGILERVGRRRDRYRPYNNDLTPMDFVNIDSTPVNLWLPFGLAAKVEIYPGNIIVISGSPNAGKTAIMMNIMQENMHTWDVRYFNSEMGAKEFKKRISKCPDLTPDMWKIKAYSRSDDFGDVVLPGEGVLNVVDFMESHEEFYIIGKKLKDIHNRLNGAVAVVGLQKNPGSDTGLGGYRSMEVCRLALAIDYGRVKITKAKNFVTDENPNGKSKQFKIVDGYKIIHTQYPWQKELKDG